MRWGNEREAINRGWMHRPRSYSTAGTSDVCSPEICEVSMVVVDDTQILCELKQEAS